MKKFLIGLIVVFMYSAGVIMIVDLILVLTGNTTPVSYPELGKAWENSKIMGYNISITTNILVGLMGLMALFGGFAYNTVLLNSEK